MKSSIPPRPHTEPMRHGNDGDVRDQVDRAALAGVVDLPQTQWRKLAGDTIRQSLALPERITQKKAPEQQTRSSSGQVAAYTRQPATHATEVSGDVGADGRYIVVAGAREDPSGRNGSGQKDGDHQDSSSDQPPCIGTHDEAHVLPLQSPSGTHQSCAGAPATQRSEPRSVTTTVTGINNKVHSSARVHLHSESVAVLIEELLSLGVSGTHQQKRLSENTRPQAVPKANTREKRRIQQAFAVADGITIIAVRTSQNNPDQHQSRSLLDALVDLLYLLIDLLNPVVDLIDPVARRAAWSQLSQLAFMTPYAGKLRTACETAMSLLDESA
jgi:hypothetical protein